MIKNLLKNLHEPLVVNSFYLYLAYFADYIFSIIILPFIARILGPEELGQVALAQMFGIIILIIIEFGFSLIATREVAKIKDDKKTLAKYIGEIYSFKILLIIISVILTIVFVTNFPIFFSRLDYVGFVLIGAILQGLVPNWFFQGIEQLKLLAISKIVFRLVGIIIILFFVKDNKDGWIVLMGYSITSGLIFIYLLMKMIQIVGKIKFSGIKKIKVIWVNSSWVFLLTIIPVLYQSGLSILLASFVSPLQLGLYFGAAKIYRAFNSLYGPISQAVYPRLVTSNELNVKKSKKLAYKLFWILLSIGLLFCALLIFFSHFFIQIILGFEFLDVSSTLKLFGIVLPLTAVSHVLGRQWMLVNGHEKILSLITVIAAIVAIGFFIITISYLNIKAIPVSLIIFELITILLILIRRRSLNFE